MSASVLLLIFSRIFVTATDILFQLATVRQLFGSDAKIARHCCALSTDTGKNTQTERFVRQQ